MSMRSSRTIRFLCTGVALVVGCLVFAGCATSKVTKPMPLALASRGHSDRILAIMPLGRLNPAYVDYQTDIHASWFLPRWLYGKGEVSVVPDPYEEFALAIYNRLRGYDIFRRVVIVKDRDEADSLQASYLLCFRINDCYAVGKGANWNFVEWLSYEGILDIDVIVYDLERNERIAYERIRDNTFNVSTWSTPDVRAYMRRTLLRGVTFHNAIAGIDF